MTEATTTETATPIARYRGEPVHQLPLDLYIPPDALEVFLETFEGPLDLLLYLIRKHNLDVLDRRVVGWLETGDGGKQVTVRELPQRDHIDVPVREQLIVELYSK